MNIKIYDELSEAAKTIREEVFMREQGFQNEFDTIDDIAKHIVFFAEGDRPIATCRVFQDEELDFYVLGRLAVIKEFRGQNVGAQMIEEAEKCVRKMGGSELALHAQCRVSKFYQKLGYAEYGEVEDDEGCPHIWMRKQL